MRIMHRKAVISRTIVVASILAFIGLSAGCGGSGGSSSVSSNVLPLNGWYSSVQVTSPGNLMAAYPIGIGLNNAGDAVLGTEQGGAVARNSARPRSLHPFPPTAPYYLWQSSNLTTLPTGYDFGPINDSGMIVANSSADVAGTYSGGVVTPLPVPSGYTQTTAQVINNAGDVAGIAVSSTGAVQAYLWKGGSATSLGLPQGVTAATCSGINAGDQIVGQYLDSQNAIHSFLWSQGALTDVGIFTPVAINTGGEITGIDGQNQPVVWNAGTLTALPLPNGSGGALGFPVAINDSGVVVGYVSTSQSSFPALWAAGKLYNLANAASTLPANSETIYDVYAINNGGQILAAEAATSGANVVLLSPIPVIGSAGAKR